MGDVTELRGLDNSTCKRILNLLEAGYLRLGLIVVKRVTVIKFGVNDGGGIGRSCIEVEVRMDATKLMNVIIAELRES